jgi:hypothetical protein
MVENICNTCGYSEFNVNAMEYPCGNCEGSRRSGVMVPYDKSSGVRIIVLKSNTNIDAALDEISKDIRFKKLRRFNGKVGKFRSVGNSSIPGASGDKSS